MKWSKYNILISSVEHGFLLYNLRSGNFLKLSEDFYHLLKAIEENILDVRKLQPEELDYLSKNKIIVDEIDDFNFITQQKYIRYLRSFNNNDLGIVLAPTLACNFACPYCYESELPSNTMSEETQEDIINFFNSFAYKCSGINLCWHGGEPLIAFNTIESLINKIKHQSKMQIKRHSMVSNGFLFTKEICDFFNDNKLNYVQITVDGNRKTHNENRRHKSGIDTYDRIIDNIKLILEKMPNCHVGIRVNIHNKNKNEFHKIDEELKKILGNKNYSISPAFVLEHKSCKVPCLSTKEKSLFFQELYYKHDYKNIRYFQPKLELGGCTAIFENSYVIDPKGKLYKCWVDIGIDEKSIGNIIKGVDNYELVSEYIIGTDKFSDPKCLDCKILPICTGGCNLYRYEYNHSKKPYNVCPLDEEELKKHIEIFYDMQIKHETC